MGWTSGSLPNHGFLLRDETSEQLFVMRGFGTREGGTTYVAKLIVQYTTDALTATPTTRATVTRQPTRVPTRTPTRSPSRTPTATASRAPTRVPTATLQTGVSLALPAVLRGAALGRR